MVYHKILRNYNFLKLWGAQLSSQLAANFLNFALIIRVFDLAEGTRYANVSVSLLVLSFGVPSIFFAIFAGSIIDHLDRKKVLVLTNICRALLVLLFLIPTIETNLIAIYLTIFVIATTTQFFVPAEAAALPQLVSKDDLVPANSLFVFTLYASFVVGYGLAGPVISKFGQNSAYWVTFTLFLLAGGLSLLLPRIKGHKGDLALPGVVRRAWRNIGRHTHEIFSSTKLTYPILQLTISQAMVGVIIVLAPALSVYFLNESLRSASTVLIIPAGIGMVGGAILIGQFFRKFNKVKMIIIGLFVAASLLLLFAAAKEILPGSVLPKVIAMVALGLGFVNALISVAAQTLLQLNSTNETRGRIFGALNMMVNIAATLPVLLAGITADLVSPASVLLLMAVLLLLYAIYQIINFQKLATEGLTEA